MNGIAIKAATAFRLGLPNIGRVFFYRLGVSLGINPVRRIRAEIPGAPFFTSVMPVAIEQVSPVSAWQSEGTLFSYWPIVLGGAPPDWFSNPFDGRRLVDARRPWWEIPDFDPAVGDIKLIWELSRMDWLLAFAQRASQGDVASLDRLNDWLSDWCSHNQPYLGPNWKCGQEASIRVMHLAMSAFLLDQIRQPAQGLLDLIRLHLQRIAPTIQYAVAQDNNHGTSEAAALFIGGSWLFAQGVKQGGDWAGMGRRWLEDRAGRLIGLQGSFSQYSTNYHRVMLDTYCMVEVWRKRMALPPFSPRLQSRLRAATQWLYQMVNPLSGDAPNVGANDGARLLPLTDTPYRDHRPTVQLAMALFTKQRAYSEEGPWNDVLRWLKVDLPSETAAAPNCYLADDGGYAILRCDSAMAMLRYPRFRFRPSQADALHLDFWLGEVNVLRDAGTYSYNTEHQWLNYFGGTASHNTVQFDDRDQMPRLSRFLFGHWLKTRKMQFMGGQRPTVVAAYTDHCNASHQRKVELLPYCLRVEDQLSGSWQKAVLRWRLPPSNWVLVGNVLSCDEHRLTIAASVPVYSIRLEKGWESRFYLSKQEVSVLEVEIHTPGIITSEYYWVQ